MIEYLAFDPGNTTGWAGFDKEGNIVEMGSFKAFIDGKYKQNPKFRELINSNIKHIVVEDYVNYGYTQQKRWSRNDTSKIIGVIETLAQIEDIPLELQKSSVRGIGYKWMGAEQPSNKAMSHEWDAAAHGVYFFTKIGIRKEAKSLLDKVKNAE